MSVCRYNSLLLKTVRDCSVSVYRYDSLFLKTVRDCSVSVCRYSSLLLKAVRDCSVPVCRYNSLFLKTVRGCSVLVSLLLQFFLPQDCSWLFSVSQFVATILSFPSCRDDAAGRPRGQRQEDGAAPRSQTQVFHHPRPHPAVRVQLRPLQALHPAATLPHAQGNDQARHAG